MLETIKDLEEELRDVSEGELDRFMELNNPRLAKLVKPGNQVLVTEEGYSCSNCDYQLNDEEAWWNYCNNCMKKFDCCKEEYNSCDVCDPKIVNLVVESYEKVHKVKVRLL